MSRRNRNNNNGNQTVVNQEDDTSAVEELEESGPDELVDGDPEIVGLEAEQPDTVEEVVVPEAPEPVIQAPLQPVQSNTKQIDPLQARRITTLESTLKKYEELMSVPPIQLTTNRLSQAAATLHTAVATATNPAIVKDIRPGMNVLIEFVRKHRTGLMSYEKAFRGCSALSINQFNAVTCVITTVLSIVNNTGIPNVDNVVKLYNSAAFTDWLIRLKEAN